ncbi:MAG: hypothetical protein ACRCXT_08685 [Paraclostridium sp.]
MLVKKLENITIESLKQTRHSLERMAQRLFKKDLAQHKIIGTYETVDNNGRVSTVAVTNDNALLVIDMKTKKVLTIIQVDKKTLFRRIYKWL